MIRSFLYCLFCFLTLGPTLFAATKVRLEHADHLYFDEEVIPDAQVLMDNVKFSHDGAVMTCDSAHFFQGTESFDAFGRILMTQGDSIRVTGDFLHYDGMTRHARLKGNVVMTNKETTLKSDSLDYDRNTQVGYYSTGGTLYDKLNTLTSVWGEYSPKTKMAKFRNDVKLIGDKTAMKTDDLNYNTSTKTAYVFGPSVMIYDNGKDIVFTHQGWYDTKCGYGEITKNNRIDNYEGKHIEGDTIKFNRFSQEGWAMSNAVLTDDSSLVSLKANFVYFRKGFKPDTTADTKSTQFVQPTGPAIGQGKGDFALAYPRALVTDYSTKDTLYISADTLRTIQSEIDTADRKAYAYGDVRLFRSNAQGRCDSVIYIAKDSTVTMYGHPIVWSDSMQVTGEWMEAVITQGKKLKEVHVMGWAAGVMDDGLGKKNQVEGKKMTGYVKDGKLDHIVANGNAESVYWARDDEGSIIGLNRGASSLLTLYIKNSQMERMVMSPNGTGSLYPESMIPEDTDTLKHYSWENDKRPRSANDVIPEYLKIKTTAVTKTNKE